MARVIFVMFIFIIFAIAEVTHPISNNAVRENRTLRSMLLLEKSVKVTKVKRAKVHLIKELAEEDENSANLSESELAELKENPMLETCVYFTFESKMDLPTLISRSEILKGSKIEKIVMKDFCDDYWVTPNFPEEVLRESDGVNKMWERDSSVHILLMVAIKKGTTENKTYRFYGCVGLSGLPTNRLGTILRIDEHDKRILTE